MAGLVLFAACGDSDSPGTDESLRALMSERGLTGDASAGRNLPDIGDPLPQLGMKLFFTKALGGDFDAACVSCHHPALGGGDALSLSIGVGADDPDLLGPGRTHPQGPLVPRNAPATFNMACWDSAIFWDGRAESLGKTSGANGDDGQGIRTPDSPLGTADPLEGDTLPTAQSRFPVTSDAEMRGSPSSTETITRRFVPTWPHASATTASGRERLPRMTGFPSFRRPSTTPPPRASLLRMKTSPWPSASTSAPSSLLIIPGRRTAMGTTVQ
jgi:hypothetical protein